MRSLPLKSTTIRLLGQILTYYFNAIADAKITEELEQYYRSSGITFATKDTVTQQRAAKLLAGGDSTPDYIIGLAFTMYRTNGYGNYICAKRLQRSLRSAYNAEINQFLKKYREKYEAHLQVTHDYEDEKDGWLPFFRFWMGNSVRTFRYANKFAQDHFEYSDKLNKHQVVKACLTVQRQNSRHNIETGKKILDEKHPTDPKIILLREAAQELSDPDLFLRSCAFTEQFAAHSDKTLVSLLKLRFPRTTRKVLRSDLPRPGGGILSTP